MIVYQSTKQGFRDDVFSNEIDKKILEAYKIHLGRSTSANETLFVEKLDVVYGQDHGRS